MAERYWENNNYDDNKRGHKEPNEPLACWLLVATGLNDLLVSIISVLKGFIYLDVSAREFFTILFCVIVNLQRNLVDIIHKELSLVKHFTSLRDLLSIKVCFTLKTQCIFVY